MGKKSTQGLVKRNGIWHIDKIIAGQRVCCSSGTSNSEEAEAFLNHIIQEKRQAKIYGVRPLRTFEEAAAAYILLSAGKKSLDSEISKLNQVIPYLGNFPIDKINRSTMDNWVDMRLEQGCATNTINHGLKMVRRVLNIAANELHDENNITWLAKAPKIKLLSVNDQRSAYPIDWYEQEKLLENLPPHLKDMCLFALNTGCRDQEICHLRWSWELAIPALNKVIFVIPKEFVKGKQDKYVVLNSIARNIIDANRGRHDEFVFTYRGNGLYQMNNTGWQKGRIKAGLPDLHVHDLRHTFATRLTELDVPHHDVRTLLGHAADTITDKYIHATLGRLQKAVDKLCPNAYGTYPKIALIRVPNEIRSRNNHAGKKKRPTETRLTA